MCWIDLASNSVVYSHTVQGRHMPCPLEIFIQQGFKAISACSRLGLVVQRAVSFSAEALSMTLMCDDSGLQMAEIRAKWAAEDRASG